MKRPRFEFWMGRVHVPPNRDWSLYLTLFGFQFEVNIALPPKPAHRPVGTMGDEGEGGGQIDS